jgi:hypothetical protein
MSLVAFRLLVLLAFGEFLAVSFARETDIMWNRAIGVVVAIAVTATTEHGLGLAPYKAFLSGVVAYFAVRYIWYAIRVRREMKSEMADAIQVQTRKISN